MRLGLDFNGVVVDSAVTKVRVAKRFFGTDLEIANTARRSLAAAMSEKDYDTLQKLVFWTSEALTSPPIPRVLSQVGRQLALGNEVLFVSRLAPEGVQFGRQWIAERDMPRDMLVSVGRGGEKGWVLGAGFDAYVDDKGAILNGLQGIVRHRFLIETPYNVHDETDEGVIRIADLGRLDEHLMDVA